MPHNVVTYLEDEAIRGVGLRVTESRRAVYSALGMKPHASADEVYNTVAASLPATSLQSVYNALSDFADHVVCTECGAIADVDCAVGHAPCLTPSDAHGFRVHTAEVTYWGLCSDCAT